MWDPREVTPGSIMPVYTWLFSSKIDFDSLPKKLSALQKVGVPYSEEEINNSIANAKEQAQVITDDLVKSNVPAAIIDKEIIALIAYLQRLGKDFSAISAEAK
jgi:cytochrome c oxidase cbb3-type subunit I/II